VPVSVVIATTLRRAVASQSVRQAIESVRAAGPDAEVVLVVNGAPPDARPAVRAPELRVLHSPTPGISTARNLGAAAARHDTVLFTDDGRILVGAVSPAKLLEVASSPAAKATPGQPGK